VSKDGHNKYKQWRESQVHLLPLSSSQMRCPIHKIDHFIAPMSERYTFTYSKCNFKFETPSWIPASNPSFQALCQSTTKIGLLKLLPGDTLPNSKRLKRKLISRKDHIVHVLLMQSIMTGNNRDIKLLNKCGEALKEFAIVDLINAGFHKNHFNLNHK
jgi:hypothetical protein